ncbi:MAG: hypothetical protein CMP39_08010 [Rickettsiales bacterium]|nr:hypothetical protein [Rickettsiales bacterium]
MNSINSISFGTSGHRGIIDKTFTVKQVRCICAAIGVLLKDELKPTVVLGYDPRRGNDERLRENSFTKTVVDTFCSYGISVDVFDTYAPTPVVSWYIQHHQLAGGIILTASHNPPSYNGIKFNPKNGAPAPTTTTAEIESLANKFWHEGVPPTALKPATFRYVFAEEAYAEHLKTLIENYSQKPLNFDDLKIAIDGKHGACGPLWEMFFALHKTKSHTLFHTEPLADFGGLEANPTKYSSLKILARHIQDNGLHLGIANDPDGDRHVVLDEHGSHLTPEETTAIIFNYLKSKGKNIKGIAATVATSRLIRQICDNHNLDYVETAVGFKYFAPFLTDCRSTKQIGLAVESSGGFSTSDHTLEKCGFLPGLLLAQIVLETGLSLSQLKHAIYSEYGPSVFVEEEFKYRSNQQETLKTMFSNADKSSLAVFFDNPISHIDKNDGLKIRFEDGSWLLMRLSGTEPIARLYAESSEHSNTKSLLKQAKLSLEKQLSMSPI